LIQVILTIAVNEQTLTIHFYTEEENVKIFYLINGVRCLKKTINFKQYTVILLHLKFIASMDIGESFRPQDASLDYQYQNNHYSLRLSTLPVRSSESLTIRILPQTKRYTLNELCL